MVWVNDICPVVETDCTMLEYKRRLVLYLSRRTRFSTIGDRAFLVAASRLPQNQRHVGTITDCFFGNVSRPTSSLVLSPYPL